MTYLYADNKCMAVIPDADDYDPPLWMDTNCKQCGAPMHAKQDTCSYCLSKRKLKSNISTKMTPICRQQLYNDYE